MTREGVLAELAYRRFARSGRASSGRLNSQRFVRRRTVRVKVSPGYAGELEVSSVMLTALSFSAVTSRLTEWRTSGAELCPVEDRLTENTYVNSPITRPSGNNGIGLPARLKNVVCSGIPK